MRTRECGFHKVHVSGARAIAMTTAAIPVDELIPPPEQFLTILF